MVAGVLIVSDKRGKCKQSLQGMHGDNQPPYKPTSADNDPYHTKHAAPLLNTTGHITHTKPVHPSQNNINSTLILSN